MKLELIATSTFGLEAVVKREIEKLGYDIIKTENGKVTFSGDERAIVRSNLWIRTADRIQLKMDEFIAEESEDLFQRTKGLPWEELIPLKGKFTVICSTVRSKLRSEPNNQKTVKKAIVERMADFYSVKHFEETGAEYTVKVSILKDRVTLTVDTTGEGLHKRGYRVKPVTAPIKETLASAMVQLSFFRKGRLMVDPCCGSGTIPIEAAMLGRNIAPGLSRHFVSEDWDLIEPEIWKEERKKAYSEINYDADIKIVASDIDEEAVAAAKENAEEAGVDDCITFLCRDCAELTADEPHGVVITNPPYCERIGDKEGVEELYRGLHKFFQVNKDWSLFIITSDQQAGFKVMDRVADRRRKLYNGRMEVCYYQFHGER